MTNLLTLLTSKRADNADSLLQREYITRSEDGFLTGRTVITLRPDGKEIARSGYDGDGLELFHEEVIHSENDTDREVLSLTYNASGALLQKKIARFDQRGEILEMIHFNPSDEIIDHQIYSYSDDVVTYRRFDELGELVESWNRTMSGKKSKEATA
ncbi:MAG: hypothetical protein M3Y56_01235 [Armatimonadota bacterium]|nr:hypothetical protein [Armatimonadota bacterium]